MSHFDEISGIVACPTEWGRWWQTLEEVYVEINTGIEISAKKIECVIRTKHLRVAINGKVLIDVSKQNSCRHSRLSLFQY